MEQMKVSEYLSKQRDKLEGVEDKLDRIASSCEMTAECLKNINEAIREIRSDLVDAATSKKSVPVNVVILLVLIGAGLISIDRLVNTRTNLNVSQRGFSLQQNDPNAKQ